MKEKWEQLKDFKDYQISDLGRVRSFKSNKKGRLLKLIVDNRGYYVINFCEDGAMFQKLVHILVAEAFIPNPDNLPMVNHKDLIKLNNKKENLEWCNNRQNVSHYYENIETASKYLGVSIEGNSFRAQIKVEGERYCLGSYKVEKEAAKIYKKALNILETKGLDKMIEYQKQIKNKFTSKYKGVSYDKSREKWIGSVFYKGKRELGKRFNTENEAVESVIAKYDELGIPYHYSHIEYIDRNLSSYIEYLTQRELLKMKFPLS